MGQHHNGPGHNRVQPHHHSRHFSARSHPACRSCWTAQVHQCKAADLPGCFLPMQHRPLARHHRHQKISSVIAAKSRTFLWQKRSVMGTARRSMTSMGSTLGVAMSCPTICQTCCGRARELAFSCCATCTGSGWRTMVAVPSVAGFVRRATLRCAKVHTYFIRIVPTSTCSTLRTIRPVPRTMQLQRWCLSVLTATRNVRTERSRLTSSSHHHRCYCLRGKV